jgi:hypothetical protein
MRKTAHSSLKATAHRPPRRISKKPHTPEGIITARCAIVFTPLEPTDRLTRPLAIEGCFQPSARDAQLRARQRNPRGSRNTVCTWRHRGESDPQHGLLRWWLDANQALGLFVEPRQDRRLQRCTTACGSSVDAPLHIRDGWGAMRSLRAGDSAVRCFLAAKRVCGGRACALGIRCDCVALQRAAAPSCWLQARRVQRAHRESNTGWAAGCNRIFNQGPPARRPGSAPAGVPRPGSAALRPVRLAAPRGELAAGGETTEESGVHSSMRPGAGSNSRCEFK